ncbi:hypothetical protein K443DRAFT_12216 [Laccaria amethystina LaAM-08-1]|uniref:Uncharacterized protein n=1 Tax=Laccaria amethystina LaAM-08-1 TaxID=1095629 RepID=A0A0C9XDR1_9AGAR|nr:hypothetical protein K443DRAFT_12216 [Laccaria amethystina LaAM-08-1]
MSSPRTKIPMRSPTWTIRIVASYPVPVAASSLPKEMDVEPVAWFSLESSPVPVPRPVSNDAPTQQKHSQRPNVSPFVLSSWSSSDFGVDAQGIILCSDKNLKHII